MRIDVWNAAARPTGYSTGVGKHYINMTLGLARLPGHSIRLVLDRAEMARDMVDNPDSELAGIPAIGIPLARKSAEALWWLGLAPDIGRWLGKVDWLYCPRELYVRSRRVPVAITVHDLYALELENRNNSGLRRRLRWRLVLQRALRHAQLVLAVSEFTRNRLIELMDLQPEKIRVVGNGIDPGFFQASSPSAESPMVGGKYVLSIGGLTHKKGAEFQLEFARELHRQLPDYRLVITGPVDPEYRPSLAGLVNVQSLTRGFPDAAMQALVRGARSVLVLSRYEGFGMPVIEAMAAGTPVLAGNRAALPEIIGSAGECHDPADSPALVQALLSLEGDPARRAAAVAAGREHARKFSWDRCVERLMAALEQAS